MTPFGTENEIVIGFDEMNDSETVNLEVTWFFEDHNINNILPALKRVAMAEAVVDEVEVTLNEKLLLADDFVNVDVHKSLFSGSGIRCLRWLEFAKIFAKNLVVAKM